MLSHARLGMWTLGVVVCGFLCNYVQLRTGGRVLNLLDKVSQKVKLILFLNYSLEVDLGHLLGPCAARLSGSSLDYRLEEALKGLGDEDRRHLGHFANLLVKTHDLLDSGNRELGLVSALHLLLCVFGACVQ